MLNQRISTVENYREVFPPFKQETVNTKNDALKYFMGVITDAKRMMLDEVIIKFFSEISLGVYYDARDTLLKYDSEKYGIYIERYTHIFKSGCELYGEIVRNPRWFEHNIICFTYDITEPSIEELEVISTLAKEYDFSIFALKVLDHIKT